MYEAIYIKSVDIGIIHLSLPLRLTRLRGLIILMQPDLVLFTIVQAKEYLEELLSPLGTVNVGRDVTSEVRQMDSYISLLVLTPKPAPSAML